MGKKLKTVTVTTLSNNKKLKAIDKDQHAERKLQIDKEIRKLKREEQLKTGIKLTTKVVPDKKKYVRRKKIKEEPEE